MNRKDILIVDDDDLVCHSLKELLGMEGYDVDSTLDGLDALKKLKDTKYSLDYFRYPHAKHGWHRVTEGN